MRSPHSWLWPWMKVYCGSQGASPFLAKTKTRYWNFSSCHLRLDQEMETHHVKLISNWGFMPSRNWLMCTSKQIQESTPSCRTPDRNHSALRITWTENIETPPPSSHLINEGFRMRLRAHSLTNKKQMNFIKEGCMCPLTASPLWCLTARCSCDLDLSDGNPGWL